MDIVSQVWWQRRRHFADLMMHEFTSECERINVNCGHLKTTPWITEDFRTKTFKMKAISIFTASNQSKYQNINLVQQLITVYYVLRETRECRHYNTSIMSDVAHTSVHQLRRIHLSISLTFRHLHGTSVTASNQSVLLWMSVLVVEFIQHILLDTRLDRRPV